MDTSLPEFPKGLFGTTGVFSSAFAALMAGAKKVPTPPAAAVLMKSRRDQRLELSDMMDLQQMSFASRG
jgi:hypothetical protein